MADLDTLRPEVHTAMEAMDADVQTLEWLCLRAELLRLVDENKRMRGIIETLDIEGHKRAEKAEAALAALKERIAEAPVASVRVDDRMHVSIGARSNAVDFVPLHTKHVALVKVEE